MATNRTTDLSSLRIDPAEYRSGLKRRWVWMPIILLVLAAIASLVVVSQSGRGEALATLTVPPPARPQKDVQMTATGYVVARRKAAVGAKISGILSYLGVEEGSTVRKGEVIARIESFDLEANVARGGAEIAAAKADLAQAKAEQVERERELSRQRSLVAADVSPRASLESADAAVDAGTARIAAFQERILSAEAQLAYAKAILANAAVVAPFDGVVLTKDAEVGEAVAPAIGGGGSTRGSMVTMADMDSLEVEADVSEANIGKLTLGGPAEIVLDAFPDRPFPAVVHQIVPTADRQKATVQVKVRFTGERTGAIPEMAAKVNFLTPKALTRPGPRNLITIPASALRGEGEHRRVLRVDDGVVSELAVTLVEPPEGGFAEIATGLAGGEEILASPGTDVVPGQKVRVKAPAAS